MLNIGMVLFPQLTQLDLTGPHEVLARLPGARVHLVSASLDPVRGDRGLTISPDVTFDSAPPLDILCVPGGAGVDPLAVAAELFGVDVAQEIQLTLEYDPAPPWPGGSPRTAPAGVVRSVTNSRSTHRAARRTIAERAAARLSAWQ